MFRVPEQADTAGALSLNTDINDELRKSSFSITRFGVRLRRRGGTSMRARGSMSSYAEGWPLAFHLSKVNETTPERKNNEEKAAKVREILLK